MPELLVVIASTRPGRAGLPVGTWVRDHAEAHGAFTTRLCDLAELALPMLDEPAHPRLQQYEHEHTKAWSRTVSQADAVLFVTPEYNHGYTAPLKNAIDFLSNEWRRKPVGLVSYGGVAGGARAVQALEPVLVCVGMLIAGAVPLPFVNAMSIKDGVYTPDEPVAHGVDALLGQLADLVDLVAAPPAT